MIENEQRQADMARMVKLKELATLGKIDGQASYFNHLIDVHGEIGRRGNVRTFTDRERERVDLFLNSFAKMTGSDS